MITPRTVAAVVVTLHVAAFIARPHAGVAPDDAADAVADPVAPVRLVDTGLYADGQPGVIAEANRPFVPQYPLWTDGAEKLRWIYLPTGTSIDASNATAWDFPVGTKFWKEFRFGGQPVETRFLWRAAAERWVFASYVWDADGRDAVRAPERGLAGIASVAPGSTRRHSIPAVSDCLGCHGGGRVEPLGFNALQLSTDRDPGAPHAEPLTARMWTVRSLADEGRLHSNGAPVVDNVRIQGDAATRSALGYLSTNCGSCHRAGAGLPLLGRSLAWSDVLDAAPVVSAMLAQRTAWQVPDLPEGTSRLLDPSAPGDSALLRRMRSRRPSSQMPAIGTVLVDEDGAALIHDWIATR